MEDASILFPPGSSTYYNLCSMLRRQDLNLRGRLPPAYETGLIPTSDTPQYFEQGLRTRTLISHLDDGRIAKMLNLQKKNSIRKQRFITQNHILL